MCKVVRGVLKENFSGDDAAPVATLLPETALQCARQRSNRHQARSVVLIEGKAIQKE